MVDTHKITECLRASNARFVLGIDGIKDEVWKVAETRLSRDECKVFDRVRAYAEYILSRGEGGMATELLRKRSGFGGFTGNTGYALGAMGYKPTLLGMYGTDGIDPVFEPLTHSCSLVSVGNPAVCNVLEFNDGKIMLPYLSELLSFDWKAFISMLDIDRLKDIFKDADILAFGYWSNLYAFDELLTGLYEHILPGSKVKRIFHDFANITKRSSDALKASLKLMAGLNEIIPMTLSLNEHEALLLLELYGENKGSALDELSDGLTALRKVIGIDEIIIHTPRFALGASADGECAAHMQAYCESPVRTAGAGDTFNAGYIAASSSGITLCERLAVGNAATSFFVTNGFPPDRESLCAGICSAEQGLKGAGLYA